MKRNLYFATAIISALAYFIFQSFSTIPPTGHTMAPGEPTCAKSGCHAGVVNSGTGMITFSFDSGGTYTPDSTYTLTIQMDDATQSRFGFQATVLDGSLAAAGTFAIADSMTTSLNSASMRDYMSHLNANTSNSWSFEWSSPPIATGDVTFYIASNAANNNGAPTGDNIYATQITVSPKMPVGIENPLEKNAISLFPNPATDYINVDLGDEDREAEGFIYNSSGQMVTTHAFENGNVIDVSFLAKGIHIIQVQSRNGLRTERFIVL